MILSKSNPYLFVCLICGLMSQSKLFSHVDTVINSCVLSMSCSRSQACTSRINILILMRFSTTRLWCSPHSDVILSKLYTSLCMRKPTIWVPTRSDTNQPVHSQKIEAGNFGFRKYRICSIRVAKTKGADLLYSY